VTTVLIGGPSAALLLDAAGPTDNMLTRLQLEGLQAEKLINQHYASGFEDLADYFESLELDWQGWADARTWTSIESDLQIRAEHDGHVRHRDPEPTTRPDCRRTEVIVRHARRAQGCSR